MMRRFLVLALIVWFSGLACADVSIHENYFPNVELTNQNGETLKFYDDVIKGKVVAISFIYTRCKDVCPTDTAQMLQVRDILGDRVGKDIFFYSISVDPENDTPSALKAYMNMFAIPTGWQFLTGKREDIVLIQKKLGLIGAQVFVVRDHNISIMLGNETSGQWIKRSPYDHPMILANLLRDTLMNFKGTHPELPAYSAAGFNKKASRGEIIYRSRCMACHTLGGGDKLGPDLAGVVAARPRDWLVRWIQQPGQMIDEGDPVALELKSKFRNLPMPNLGLNEVDVAAVIDYMAEQDRALAKASSKEKPRRK
jgi:protein SCO1/2